MPDLHRDAVHAFWDSYDRKTLYRVICLLEQVETWTLDTEPDIEPAVLELGRVIDRAKEFNFSGNEDAVIMVLASMSTARALRVMQSLDMLIPNTAADLLMYAEEKSKEPTNSSNAHIKLFLSRNMVFEKLQLLSRVFAQQRLALVVRAMENYSI